MKEPDDTFLKLYSDAESVSVSWLWYPYIPLGKVTLLQGDPGEGKSMLMMKLMAALSTGEDKQAEAWLQGPKRIIYQCSEDGVSDTIKPRLLSAKADTRQIAYIDEDAESLTLDDEKIRTAIEKFGASLLVIDPLQAYMGDGDLFSIGSLRRIMKKLAFWAAANQCAIVLVGHLNKNEGRKDLYRSLGSIDMVAAARSVLQIERLEEDPDIRVVHHIKSSLAPAGKDLYFRIDRTAGLQWIEYNPTVSNTPEANDDEDKISKQDLTAKVLWALLANGPVRSVDVMDYFDKMKISQRTLNIVKKIVGIKSFKKDGQWFWAIEKDISAQCVTEKDNVI